MGKISGMTRFKHSGDALRNLPVSISRLFFSVLTPFKSALPGERDENLCKKV